MKPFSKVASVLLGVISILQLTRFLMGWPVTVNGVSIPVWVSGIAFAIAGGFSVMLWREARR